MSCTVAISNSPVFSPSRVPSSLLCKASVSSSPENLTHALSPASALKLRLQSQKPPPQTSGLIRDSDDGASTSSSSPTVLKRKRPARLDIPVASLSFGGGGPATASAAEERGRDVVEVEGDGYSVYCKRGRREFMEDRFSAAVNVHGDPKQAFFGVFDGHGGAKAAEFAAQNLEKEILSEVERRDGNDIAEAVKNGYLTADAEFLKQGLRGGTCCATALIREGNLVVSNAGDCRAVVSRGGVAEALTCDQRPSREDEKHRIEALGGYVDCCHGVWRIQGSLAVSRGIGDQHLKQWVTAEPETKVVQITSELEFLILASDGLWDKVSSQEVVDIARPLCINSDRPEPLSVCKKLVDISVSRGSVDDISVMLIQLGRFC
ncbi:hypothetical protein RJ639_016209 [Escallonia herrerae]|uniref:protein-serine/threonine phosphatase n=1 Tax=Escallonia herrerae TaxID=1293975 RepID=A0AA88VEV3_9ASTE|nr:hypothetical protein RJ639_016209 [Escallonia herrerae]